MTRRSLSALALVGSLAACSSAKPQAASLVASVEMFHRASNEERPQRADALASVVCSDPEVCDAKKLCVEAATATATALRLKHEAETTLAEVEAGKRERQDPSVAALPAKLDEATVLLKRGRDAMPACDQKILVLRERYGL
jgi:hypothetical protein